MRRLLVFGFLGPLLGYLTLLTIVQPLVNWMSGGQGDYGANPMAEIPLAYVVGVIPALAAAVADRWIALRGIPWRPAWAGVCAFGTTLVPVVVLAPEALLDDPAIAVLGVIGAVPGSICSVLSGGPTRC